MFGRVVDGLQNSIGTFTVTSGVVALTSRNQNRYRLAQEWRGLKHLEQNFYNIAIKCYVFIKFLIHLTYFGTSFVSEVDLQ